MFLINTEPSDKVNSNSDLASTYKLAFPFHRGKGETFIKTTHSRPQTLIVQWRGKSPQYSRSRGGVKFHKKIKQKQVQTAVCRDG